MFTIITLLASLSKFAQGILIINNYHYEEVVVDGKVARTIPRLQNYHPGFFPQHFTDEQIEEVHRHIFDFCHEKFEGEAQEKVCLEFFFPDHKISEKKFIFSSAHARFEVTRPGQRILPSERLLYYVAVDKKQVLYPREYNSSMHALLLVLCRKSRTMRLLIFSTKYPNVKGASSSTSAPRNVIYGFDGRLALHYSHKRPSIVFTGRVNQAGEAIKHLQDPRFRRSLVEIFSIHHVINDIKIPVNLFTSLFPEGRQTTFGWGDYDYRVSIAASVASLVLPREITHIVEFYRDGTEAKSSPPGEGKLGILRALTPSLVIDHLGLDQYPANKGCTLVLEMQPVYPQIPPVIFASCLDEIQRAFLEDLVRLLAELLLGGQRGLGHSVDSLNRSILLCYLDASLKSKHRSENEVLPMHSEEIAPLLNNLVELLLCGYLGDAKIDLRDFANFFFGLLVVKNRGGGEMLLGQTPEILQTFAKVFAFWIVSEKKGAGHDAVSEQSRDLAKDLESVLHSIKSMASGIGGRIFDLKANSLVDLLLALKEKVRGTPHLTAHLSTLALRKTEFEETCREVVKQSHVVYCFASLKEVLKLPNAVQSSIKAVESVTTTTITQFVTSPHLSNKLGKEKVARDIRVIYPERRTPHSALQELAIMKLLSGNCTLNTFAKLENGYMHVVPITPSSMNKALESVRKETVSLENSINLWEQAYASALSNQ